MPTVPTSTATRQFAGCVLAQIIPEQLGTLRALLEQLGQDTQCAMQGCPKATSLIPFHRMKTVHYARFVILECDPKLGPTLVFSTCYDGPEGEDACLAERALRLHVEDLLLQGNDGLARVFACCVGYRPGQLAEFIKRHQIAASTFYVGAPGRSRNQILWEAELRRKVDDLLDASNFRDTPAARVRTSIIEQLTPEYGKLPDFPEQPDRTGRVTAARSCLVALALTIGITAYLTGGLYGITAILVTAGALVWRFRYLEQTDPQFQLEYSDATVDQFRQASADENHFLQNQLTHFVPIKPGPLRWLLIRAVFLALQFLAKNQYNRGKLGNIPSIHFARWILLPNRGVLFLSNFDNSWQSYLGDFIDQASSGLTAVWSNTQGYPRTTWLLTAGSRDAERFLAWTRHHQLPTQVWYSAYPGLSIVNINANTDIRRGLANPETFDAATWLFRLRDVNRVEADQLYGEERTREPPLPRKDIQGIILWGYGHLPEARYLMFRIAPKAQETSRSWLSQLPLASAAGESMVDEPPEPMLNLAFTYPGLRALGVDESLCSSFSTPFVQGSDNEYRARGNGDVGADAPNQWQWGGPNNPVHLVLLVFAKTKQSLAGYVSEYLEQATAAGLLLVQDLEGTTLPGRKEHFGFRDGIAQPRVEGSGRGELEDNTVAAGEFLLGHPDGYGNLAHSPVSPDGFAFGINGSYLVFRQLEQDVEGFWRYCAAQSTNDAVKVASKMVGRWPSGAPLVRHPNQDPESPLHADEDNFTYLANDENNDRYGARCPFGAHIRRANPRDWQLGPETKTSLALSNLHRILRRGRPYGPPLSPSMTTPELLESATRRGASATEEGVKRGLQFLCFNANIERQFEFIQQQWLNNPKFAGQNGGPDPLLGMRYSAAELGLGPQTFTVQSDVKTGVCPRTTELGHFVRVVGSAYFFMPSIPAVRLLGNGLSRVASTIEQETIPPDEQLHIDSLLGALREKMKRDYLTHPTLRDAHPKMHGCLRALFKVESDLASELRVGIFRGAETYQAWVRFSNADGRVGSDTKKDIRGLAIKLLGVPGTKLLEGSEFSNTHDFLLVSHDTFVARDVAQFDELVHAMIGGNLSLMTFLAKHPRVGYKLLTSLRQHASLLDLRYFSMVPYLFGSRPAKYCLTPTKPPSGAIMRNASPNFLRDDLVERLTDQTISFDFMVQCQTDPKEMPVEDPTIRWSETRAPFRKLATLELPPQEFDTPARRSFGENLSFNPWRCLPEHRPLGGINRARRQVYRALSSFRHDRNTAPESDAPDNSD